MIIDEPALFVTPKSPLKTQKQKVHYPSARDPGQVALTESRHKGYAGNKIPSALEDLDQLEDVEGAVFVDPERGTGAPEDIKTALDRAKKLYGREFGSFVRKRPDRFEFGMSEEEFGETGGIVGYIERARNLVRRRKYKPALMYLDFAITFGCRELSNFAKTETPEILLGRKLRAECLHNEQQHREALNEADKILKEHREDTFALYIKAESYYHTCQFEKALKTYYQGLRSRSPLYVTAFEEGIRKSKRVLQNCLVVLEEAEIKRFLSKVAMRTLRKKTKEQGIFEILVKRAFSDQINFVFLSEEEKTKKEADEDLGYHVAPIVNLAAFGPLAAIKRKFTKMRENKKKHDEKMLLEGIAENKPLKSKTNILVKPNIDQAPDLNIRRLKSDEKFLDFLKDNVLKDLEKKLEAQNISRKKKKKKFQTLEDKHKKAKQHASKYDKDLMQTADDALSYIDRRKVFWTAQSGLAPLPIN